MEEFEREPQSRVIVLVGNAHAATTGVDGSWLPMGHFLKQEHPGMVNLDMRSGGGESWCFIEEPGVHAAGGDGAVDAYGIDLGATNRQGGFSGVYDVGRMTASMPARPESVEEWLSRNRAAAPPR